MSPELLPNGQKPPTFEPWLGRVRLVRAWTAMVGFLVVTALSHSGARAWDEALLHGFIGAAVLYFLAWGSALLLFGELYHVQVARVKAELEARAQEQQDVLQRRYDDRVRELHGIPEGGSVDGLGLGTPGTNDVLAGTSTSGFAPPAREAA